MDSNLPTQGAICRRGLTPAGKTATPPERVYAGVVFTSPAAVLPEYKKDA